jgi:hypothetical protein
MTEPHPNSGHAGHVRISPPGQTLDAQLEQLTAEGCAKIPRGKASGVKAYRRALLRLLEDLGRAYRLTLKEFARSYNFSQATISRLGA